MKAEIIFKNIIFIILFFNFFTLKAQTNSVKIITKINNEIITNVDVLKESNYLVTLNKELKKLNDDDLMSISKNSLIREKIKLSEIKKYENLEDSNFNKLLSSIMKNFYLNLNLKNENEFKKYLFENELTINEVEQKIKIEILWNKLIGRLYSNQIYIDEEKIKKKIKQKKLNIDSSINYDLSEILFEIPKNKNLEEIYQEIINNIDEFGFKAAANRFSISDTAKFGGKIGTVSTNQLSKIILQNINDLSIDEITKPIKVGAGYLILKINDKTETESIVDETKLLNQLINAERERQFQQYSLIYFNKVKLNSIVYNE